MLAMTTCVQAVKYTKPSHKCPQNMTNARKICALIILQLHTLWEEKEGLVRIKGYKLK